MHPADNLQHINFNTLGLSRLKSKPEASTD